MLINIDFHGTLGSALHDRWLQHQIIAHGVTCENNSPVWDSYARMVYNTRNVVQLNAPLIKFVAQLKDAGHHLRLWTNANSDVAKSIKHTLNGCNSLFDSYMFCSGKKSK